MSLTVLFAGVQPPDAPQQLPAGYWHFHDHPIGDGSATISTGHECPFPQSLASSGRDWRLRIHLVTKAPIQDCAISVCQDCPAYSGRIPRRACAASGRWARNRTRPVRQIVLGELLRAINRNQEQVPIAITLTAANSLEPSRLAAAHDRRVLSNVNALLPLALVHTEAATLDSYRAPDLVASWMSWSHGKGPVKFAARNRPAVRGITGDDFPALRQYQPSLNRARIWWITREVKQHQAELYRQANSRRFTKPRLQHEQRLARFLTRGRPTSPKAHCGRRDSREHGQSPPHHCLLTVATRA